MPRIQLQRGGARNFADRRSFQLRENDCSKLIGASHTALKAGKPFNRFITASWGIGGIPADQAVGATSRFIGLARNWLRARGHPLAWVSVQERGKRVGQHAHILLHVPPDLAPLFRAMPRRWASTILPEGYRSGVINTKRLKSAGAINSLSYEAELLGNIHYMLKCAPIELEKSLGMVGRGHERWGQSCLVIGKRAGVWQQWKSIAAEAK